MYGFSYSGMLQLLGATERPPGLQAIVPALAPSQMREGWLYNGGAFAIAFALGWTLELGRDLAHRLRPDLEAEFVAALSAPTAHYAFRPLRDQPLVRSSGIAPFYFDWMDHEVDDDYWATRQVESRYADLDVPALHIGGWYDSFIDGTLHNFSGVRADAASQQTKLGQRLLVGPWHHIPTLTPLGPVDFGPGCETVIDRLQLRWFDLWLRDVDDGLVLEPRVRLFAMGANRWLDLDDWLPVTTVRRFYLHSGGRANSREGDGQLSEVDPDIQPPDIFVYDPASPVPSAGGHSCCFPTAAPMGPQDQRPVEVLNGVLVYTSEPLDRDLLVVGPITARLYAASDARDTDWVVRVCDLRPDGVSLNIKDGIVRARHAGPSADTKLLTPGEVSAYDVFVGSTCHLFRCGHRIRVHVTSSSFPTWEPNPNTGRPLGVDGIGDLVVATNLVLHEPDAPSAIDLSVLDGAL
jgi:putative CocE/NonD family hydrolase